MLAYAGPILALCWPYVGLCWPYLGPCWPYLGPSWPCLGPVLALCWPYVGLCWPYVGPCWPHVDPSWGLCWRYLGRFFPYLCCGYVETPSRRQLFRFFHLPGAQNHVKTKVFAHRQHKIRGRRKARNTVKKKRCFWRPRAKSIVNYKGISSPGVGRGSGGGRAGVNRRWVGGRGRSAYNLRLPPKAVRAVHGLDVVTIYLPIPMSPVTFEIGHQLNLA